MKFIKYNILTLSIFALGVFSCNQALANNGTAHLRGCVYLPTQPAAPMNFKFEVVSDYCMYDPDSKYKASKSLNFTVNKVGLTCSEGDTDGYGYLSVKYSAYDSDMSRGSCSLTVSKTLVSFDDGGAYNIGADLLWGGKGSSKYWRHAQVYYESSSDKFRLCENKALCSTASGSHNTIFYRQGQDLYVIYTPQSISSNNKVSSSQVNASRAY